MCLLLCCCTLLSSPSYPCQPHAELCAAFPGSADSSLLRTGDLGTQPRPKCCCLCRCRDSLLPQDVLVAAGHFLQWQKSCSLLLCSIRLMLYAERLQSFSFIFPFGLHSFQMHFSLSGVALYRSYLCSDVSDNGAALWWWVSFLISLPDYPVCPPGLLVIAPVGPWCNTDLVRFVGCSWSHYPLSQTSFVWLLQLHLTSYLYWTTVQALWVAFDSTICGDFLRPNESLEQE